MLWHYLPNVPFNSGHQEQHLLVVDGLGRNNPVYWFPKFTGGRHRLREGMKNTCMWVIFNMFLSVIYTENTSWGRRQGLFDFAFECHRLHNISKSEVIAQAIHLMFGENKPVCVPEHFKCQVDKKRKRLGKSSRCGYGWQIIFCLLIKNSTECWVTVTRSFVSTEK